MWMLPKSVNLTSKYPNGFVFFLKLMLKSVTWGHICLKTATQHFFITSNSIHCAMGWSSFSRSTNSCFHTPAFTRKSSYILRRPQNFAKSPPYFWLQYIQSKVKWRFLKILWPSQNIWTLTPKNILYLCQKQRLCYTAATLKLLH